MVRAKIENNKNKMTARRNRWPFAAVSAMLCLACARHGSVQRLEFHEEPHVVRTLPAPQTKVHRLTVPPPMIDRVISEAQVKCESQEDCPTNIAMLIIKEKSGLSQCTGFLIGTQTLMTNSHCLPKELRTPGTSCADLTAVFPDAGVGAESISCETVEFASEISSDEGTHLSVDLEHRNQPRMDFAILRLKTKSSRRPLTISGKGLLAAEELTAWTIDPVSDVNPGGTFRKKTCQPVSESVLAPEFTGKNEGRLAQVAALSGCEILHGNSGSPLVDAEGQVRALIFATLPVRQTDGQTFKAMSLATNLACLDPASPKSDKCVRHLKPETGPLLDRSSAVQLKLELRRWARKEGMALSRLGPLSLVATDDGETDLVWSEPRCLKESLTSRVEISGAPLWRVRFRVNEVYQPQVTILSRGQMSMALSPTDLGQKLKIERHALFAEPSEQPTAFATAKSIQLPLCRSQSHAANHSLD